MPGRGDNNKKGSADRGGSSQSNQGSSDAARGKSKPDKKQTGNRSDAQSKTSGQDAGGKGRHATDEELARDKEMD